jgi:acetyl/propionyl-CoA carboxylase alpha subunit
VEVRLYAEDPLRDFLPVSGHLDALVVPPGDGVRVDSGVESGDDVSTNYDPLLAKVIAHGATREEAVARLARTLRRTRVQGLTTNRALLVGILEHDDFVAGRVDTHFLDRVDVGALVAAQAQGLGRLAAGVAALAEQAEARAQADALATLPSGFRNNPSQLQTRDYLLDGEPVHVGYRLGRDPVLEVDGESVDATVLATAAGVVDLVCDGVRRRFRVSTSGTTTYVGWPHGSVELGRVARFPDLADHLEPGSLVAPMPGTVVRVVVDVGDPVAAGQTVMVVEAMKMEHSVVASEAGVVADIPVERGQAVDTGQVLVVLDTDSEEPA